MEVAWNGDLLRGLLKGSVVPKIRSTLSGFEVYRTEHSRWNVYILFPLHLLVSGSIAQKAGHWRLYTARRAAYVAHRLFTSWLMDSRTKEYCGRYLLCEIWLNGLRVLSRATSIVDKAFVMEENVELQKSITAAMLRFLLSLMGSYYITAVRSWAMLRWMQRWPTNHRCSSILRKISTAVCQQRLSGLKTSFITSWPSPVASRRPTVTLCEFTSHKKQS